MALNLSLGFPLDTKIEETLFSSEFPEGIKPSVSFIFEPTT
jgi:hypothetical protein